MQIYLPIAEISVNMFLLVGIGGLVGFLSGLFGVGGGFLITPLLLFIGVPPGVAVATGANQVVASSVSGVLAQMRRKGVDLRMGSVLLAGGIAGAATGIWVFNQLARVGQLELVVQLAYVVMLGSIGLMMLQEGLRAINRARRAPGAVVRRQHSWVQGGPFKVKFRASGLYISVLPPVLVGFAVGLMSAIMGVGGGFVMVPAMIYILGMPARVVIGTSLFQICFVSAFSTFMHAVTNQSVDMVLAVVLIAGGVIGAQFGTQFGARLKAEHMRILLSLLVLLVAGKLAWDLIAEPAELYSLAEARR